VGGGLTSHGKRVSKATIITVMISLILGLYVFLELNFVIGFLMIMIGAFVYYSRKRLEGVG
jgi:sugar phosphate permease